MRRLWGKRHDELSPFLMEWPTKKTYQGAFSCLYKNISLGGFHFGLAPTSLIWVSMQVPVAPFSVQFLDNGMEKAKDAPNIWAPDTHVGELERLLAAN